MFDLDLTGVCPMLLSGVGNRSDSVDDRRK